MQSKLFLSQRPLRQSRVAFYIMQLTSKSPHYFVMSTRYHLIPLFKYLSSPFFWFMSVQLKSEPIRSLQPHLQRLSSIALLPLPNSKILQVGSTISTNNSLSTCGCIYQSYISCCYSSQREFQQDSVSQSGRFQGNPFYIRNCLYLLSLANQSFCYMIIKTMCNISVDLQAYKLVLQNWEKQNCLIKIQYNNGGWCGNNNNIYHKLKMIAELSLMLSTPKKIYHTILACKEQCPVLQQALQLLIRSTLVSQEHMNFLIHKINWFEEPFISYQNQLIKILRIYRSQSKQSARVAYHLLIDGFTLQTSHKQALGCLMVMFKESYDKRTIIECLRQNYPHKLCGLQIHKLFLEGLLELGEQFKDYRTDLLEIIIENLASFDTEVLIGDQWVHYPFVDDQKIINLRENRAANEMAENFDILMHYLLSRLVRSGQCSITMSQMLLIFQNKILPIKTTKLIQFIVFVVAEKSKSNANTFISFLLSNIFDPPKQQHSYRLFTQSNFYLFSYILRSKSISISTVSKITLLILDKLAIMIKNIPTSAITESFQLKDFFNKNQMILVILQTVIILRISLSESNDRVASKYQSFIRQAKNKLHFQYFLKEEILQKVGICKQNNDNNVVIKYSNKFIPCVLPLTAGIMDSVMNIHYCNEQRQKLNILSKSQQGFQPCLRKMHKGQVASYTSETLLTIKV